jgi:uncharacterized protein YfiM (DUF2279 family)
MNKVAIALSLLAVFLLSGSGLIAANAQGTTQQQPLSFSAFGGVASAGNQYYDIQQSGQPVMASIVGYTFDSAQPVHFTYYLSASVNGLSSSGVAFFDLTASLVGGGTVTIMGYAPINSQVPALCLPSGSTSGMCAPGDTSSIPAFFVSSNTMLLIVTNLNGHTSMQTQTLPMLFESAYMNPFGAPIVLGSADSFATLLIITPYSTGTVSWNGVVTEAQVMGTYGTTSVSGNLVQVTSEHENLVTGTSNDHGTMALSHMVDSNGNPVSALDARGTFSGTSVTPMQGGVDCSSSIGFPVGFGVCTMYGFDSTGTFNLSGSHTMISGSYSTVWGIPAFTFTASATGTVTTTPSNDWNSYFSWDGLHHW